MVEKFGRNISPEQRCPILNPWPKLTRDDQQAFAQCLTREYPGKGKDRTIKSNLINITAVAEHYAELEAAVGGPKAPEIAADIGRGHMEEGYLIFSVRPDFASEQEYRTAIAEIRRLISDNRKAPFSRKRAHPAAWLTAIEKLEREFDKGLINPKTGYSKTLKNFTSLFVKVNTRPEKSVARLLCFEKLNQHMPIRQRKQSKL